MHFCALPDDILRLVVEATMVDRNRPALPFNRAMSLLAVCRQLRHVALRVVYNTVALHVGDWREPMDAQPARGLPSLDLAVSVGCVQCIRRLTIVVEYESAPTDGLRAAAERLRAAAGKLAGVVTLRFDVVSRKRMLGWDGVDAADHGADIQAICGGIVAAMPGVCALFLALTSPDSVAQEVGQRLVARYSGQLETLVITGPVAIPRGTEFKQLGNLNLDYGYISTSRAPRVNPAGLEVLNLRGRLTTTAWASFAACVRDRELTFANLKTLYLVSSSPVAMPSLAAQPHGRSAWRLHFPSLRNAYIHCSQGPFPVLEWVVFPPRMAVLSIGVTPGVIQVIDEVVDIPAVRQFSLMVPCGFGDDPAVLAMVHRVLEKAHRCETRRLVVPGSTSPTVIDMVASAPVTHLLLDTVDMDVVAGLIRRTSNITNLNIICLNTDDAQLDVSVPPPGSGRAVEPLNTSITELQLGWDSIKWGPDAVSAAKYLLLALPSLLRLIVSDTLSQQLAEFVDAHSACYPHLLNVAIRAR